VTEGPNSARIREAIERWNRGDRAAPLEDIDPDVEIRTGIGDAFQGEPFRGHEGARQWLAGLDENFETWEILIDECREQGDVVLVLGGVRAKGRGSGIELEQEIGWVYEFRDDKMIRLHTYYDREQAIAASGLS
jgi:ketosteroid isomerase-like protein